MQKEVSQVESCGHCNLTTNHALTSLGVIALKRLFAIMSLTRRSFVHISEVTQAFDIQLADYMRSGFASDWTTNLGRKQIFSDPIVEWLTAVALYFLGVQNSTKG